MGKLIVGLGNPGKEYEKNRHNIGFMAVEKICKAYGFDDFKEEKKFEAEIVKGKIGSETVILAKPLTFMNKSGVAIRKIKDYFKIGDEDTIVIFDDVDLKIGAIRIRKKGGAGTHNGMKSIVQETGTENSPRIRIGTESRGELAPKKQEISSFVLSDFSKKEILIIDKTINKIPEIIEVMLGKGVDAAMTKFNSP